MKAILKYILLVASSLLAGYGLGYVRLPMLEEGPAFWVGMTGGAGAAVVLLGWLLMVRRGPSGKGGRLAWTLAAFALLLAIAAILFAWMQRRDKEAAEARILEQERHATRQTAMIDSLLSQQNGRVIAQVLDMVRVNMKYEPFKVSEASVDLIVSLSNAMRPRPTVGPDNWSTQLLSPERGLLLVGLVSSRIDSVGWANILSRSTFAYADLEGADLRFANLDGIDLQHANLRDANLDHAMLRGARMRFAKLWGASLHQADISQADLTDADLEWVQAGSLRGEGTIFNGANLQSAQLQQADLRQAKLRFVHADVAQMPKADLRGADLKASFFTGVNLKEAQLQGANLKMVDFRGAQMAPLGYDSVRLGQPTWAKVLGEWHSDLDSAALATQYSIVKDTTKRFEAEYIVLPRR